MKENCFIEKVQTDFRGTVDELSKEYVRRHNPLHAMILRDGMHVSNAAWLNYSQMVQHSCPPPLVAKNWKLAHFKMLKIVSIYVNSRNSAQAMCCWYLSDVSGCMTSNNIWQVDWYKFRTWMEFHQWCTWVLTRLCNRKKKRKYERRKHADAGEPERVSQIYGYQPNKSFRW